MKVRASAPARPAADAAAAAAPVAVPVEVTVDGESPRGGRWRVVAPMPVGAPGTTLAARPPRYWELDLRADVPGVDYAGRYLVPVY